MSTASGWIVPSGGQTKIGQNPARNTLVKRAFGASLSPLVLLATGREAKWQKVTSHIGSLGEQKPIPFGEQFSCQFCGVLVSKKPTF